MNPKNNERLVSTKRLKFAPDLVPQVLAGTSRSTWRISYDKNLTTGDSLSLQTNEGVEFARAIITNTKITTFGELTEEDKSGHEEFLDASTMLETYSNYYGFEVTNETELKISWFELIIEPDFNC